MKVPSISVHFGCQKVNGTACMLEDDIDMCDTADFFIRCPNGIVGLMQYLSY